ncbi:hypothetical protein [Candidatus Tisiphia endosymbiont of Hybos culiciformis]
MTSPSLRGATLVATKQSKRPEVDCFVVAMLLPRNDIEELITISRT